MSVGMPRRSSIVLVVTALAACTTVDTPASGPASAWSAPDAYEFVLEASCGESALYGRFHVVVVDGQVSEVEALDESGRSMLRDGSAEDIPTLADLMHEVERAEERGADVVDVDTAPAGWPRQITIDGDVETYDDESCYLIADYQEDR